MEDKCADCKKEYLITELNQVRNPNPGHKYKLVCDTCLKKKDYQFIGRLKQ